MQSITVQPAPERRVRLETGELITGPVEVPRTGYYLRRLRDGDLVEIQPATTHSTPRRRAEKE